METQEISGAIKKFLIFKHIIRAQVINLIETEFLFL